MYHLSEVDTLNQSMPRRILVFKTLHPVGPAPAWCWGTVKATEDKLVSVPSLSSVIINTTTTNHFLNNVIKYLMKIILQ